MTNSLLNTVAASAADISFSGQRKLNIVTDSGTFPQMQYERIKSFTTSPSLLEKTNTQRVNFTAADNTAYGFTVVQTVAGFPVQRDILLEDSGVGATESSIGTALKNSANSMGLKITATWTSPDAFIVIVGQAGYPLFNATAGAGTTVTTHNATGVTVASVDTGTQLVTATGNHGLATGNLIKISGSVTPGNLPDGTYKVIVAAPTTFYIYDLNNNPVVVTTTTAAAGLDFVPTQGQGVGADLAGLGIAGATSGETYTAYGFVFGYETPGAEGSYSQGSAQHILYVKDTSTTALATNFGNFSAEINKKIGADQGSGVVSPAVVRAADVAV